MFLDHKTKTICILMLIREGRRIFRIYQNGLWVIPEEIVPEDLGGVHYSFGRLEDSLLRGRSQSDEHLFCGPELHGLNVMNARIRTLSLDENRYQLKTPDSDRAQWVDYRELINRCELTKLTSLVVSDLKSRGLLL